MLKDLNKIAELRADLEINKASYQERIEELRAKIRQRFRDEVMISGLCVRPTDSGQLELYSPNVRYVNGVVQENGIIIDPEDILKIAKILEEGIL